MRRDVEEPAPAPERIALLLLLATFLFVGALRAFLSAVYYDNLVALELGPTAAYALLLLAPIVFLLRVPARPMLLGAAVALALARILLAPTRGTALHLPLAGVAAASWLLLLGALLPTLRGPNAAAGAVGAALGWALDVALLWLDDSADPTRGLSGLFILVPAGALLLLAAWQKAARIVDAPLRGGWGAGAAFGVWLFLQNTLAGNPYGVARWNGADPPLLVGASLLGLVVGALLVARTRAWPRWGLLALHLGALLAVVDHVALHSPALPLLVVVLQATLVVDLALLLVRLTPRGLILTALVTLVLHFVYAFTFLFDYVPLSAAWEGRAPVLYVLAAAFLVGFLLRSAPSWTVPDLRRTLPTLVFVPVLIGLVAAATPGADVGTPREGSIRVMSFNVHQGFANDGVLDVGVFVPVIEAADPDVVFLQEGDTPRFTSGNVDVAGYLAQKLGYHLAYGQPTRAQAFGGAILSRLPIEEWQTYELPSESDDRWYIEARLDAGGTDLWAYGVHFALPHGDRIAEADALLAQAATRAGPKVLAGDFNSCPDGLCPDYEENVSDDVYATITAAYQDAWVAGGRGVDDPAGHTFDADDPYERIDYVFVTRDIAVTVIDRIRTPDAIRASDHLPILVDLRLA